MTYKTGYRKVAPNRWVKESEYQKVQAERGEALGHLFSIIVVQRIRWAVVHWYITILIFGGIWWWMRDSNDYPIKIGVGTVVSLYLPVILVGLIISTIILIPFIPVFVIAICLGFLGFSREISIFVPFGISILYLLRIGYIAFANSDISKIEENILTSMLDMWRNVWDKTWKLWRLVGYDV